MLINIRTKVKKINQIVRLFLIFIVFNAFFCKILYHQMKKIVIFASGSGSNAENIILKLKENNTKVEFTIFTNNSKAKVLDRAEKLNVATQIFNKTELLEGFVLGKLKEIRPDLIVLAGFLLHLPMTITVAFPNKIINIHPALLPKYGGIGMYGNKIHEAVLANKEAETGITIHFVNEFYDNGAIIFQKSIPIISCTTYEMIADKIHSLEMAHFPNVIIDLLEKG